MAFPLMGAGSGGGKAPLPLVLGGIVTLKMVGDGKVAPEMAAVLGSAMEVGCEGGWG